VIIYVDADAAPNTIKTILFKAAIRVGCELIFVANQSLQLFKHPLIKMHCVSAGFDVADNYIADIVQPNDLVITADIPLADQVITKKAAALNPRGYMYDEDTIKQRLSVRNHMDSMRTSGVHTGGPKVMDKQDTMKFANALDRYLQKHCRRAPSV
jgi:uncharacterized protein